MLYPNTGLFVVGSSVYSVPLKHKTGNSLSLDIPLAITGEVFTFADIVAALPLYVHTFNVPDSPILPSTTDWIVDAVTVTVPVVVTNVKSASLNVIVLAADICIVVVSPSKATRRTPVLPPCVIFEPRI